MQSVFAGIQQVGIGVSDVEQAYQWYKKHFGMDIPMFRDSAEAKLMVRYTGGEAHRRTAYLALNVAGGAGFEIWQYTSRKPQPASFPITLSTAGIVAVKMKTRSLTQAANFFENQHVNLLQKNLEDNSFKSLWLTDPYGNLFQCVEDENWFAEPLSAASTGGVVGAVIAVKDMDKALAFYKKVLNLDQVIYDKTGVFEDLKNVPGGKSNLRRVLLTQSQGVTGAFSRMLGPSQIELICTDECKEQPHSFANRYWGDLGYIHLCFDTIGMKAHENNCEALGYPLTVNSAGAFDMGEAAGQFTYNEDPDGTLLEYVETFKIPMLKSIGWYLDLRKRDSMKPLPNWMIKTLRFNREK